MRAAAHARLFSTKRNKKASAVRAAHSEAFIANRKPPFISGRCWRRSMPSRAYLVNSDFVAVFSCEAAFGTDSWPLSSPVYE